MIDPINTTALDGAACAFCGEDAEGTALMQKHAQEVPLCGRCLDRVEPCPDCEQQFWGPDGYRLYDSANLYCPSCAAKHPAMVMGRELEARIDERAGK